MELYGELEKIHPANIEPLGIIEKYQNQQAGKLVRFPAFSRFFDNTQRFNQSGTYFIAFSSDFCAVRSKKNPQNMGFSKIIDFLIEPKIDDFWDFKILWIFF